MDIYIMDSIYNETPALWELKSTEVALKHDGYTICKETFQHPHRQKAAEICIAKMSDGVIIVPVTHDNKIILIQQYRFGCQQILWELPGGGIDGHESAIEGAIRELLEETGYAGEDPMLLASCYSNPAFISNCGHYIGIKNCCFKQAPDWDETEEILVKTVTIEEAKAMVDSGQICNTMTLTGLFLAQSKGLIKW